MVSMSNVTSGSRRRWITVLCGIATIAGIVVGGFFLYNHLTGDAANNTSLRLNMDVLDGKGAPMTKPVEASSEENNLNLNLLDGTGAPATEAVEARSEENNLNLNVLDGKGASVTKAVAQPPSEAVIVDQGKGNNIIIPEVAARPLSKPSNLSIESNIISKEVPTVAVPPSSRRPAIRRNPIGDPSPFNRVNINKIIAASRLTDIEMEEINYIKEMKIREERKKRVDGKHEHQAASKPPPKGPAAVPKVPSCGQGECVTRRAESVHLPVPEPVPSTSRAVHQNNDDDVVAALHKERALGATANVGMKADDSPLQVVTFKPTCKCFKHYAPTNYEHCRSQNWVRTDSNNTNTPIIGTLSLNKLADALKCIYAKPGPLNLRSESKSPDCVELEIMTAASNPSVKIINPANEFMVMTTLGSKFFCTVKYKNRTLAVLKDVKAPQKMFVTKENFNGGTLFSIWKRGNKSGDSMVQVILKNNTMYVNDHYVDNLLMFFGITLPNER